MKGRFDIAERPNRVYNLKVKKRTRKQLRRNMTEPEIILWSHLKGKKFKGLKFRRQHSIGKYVVDFYCAEKNLIVELDGG